MMRCNWIAGTVSVQSLAAALLFATPAIAAPQAQADPQAGATQNSPATAPQTETAAQPAGPQADTGQLADIVVTAQRRSESLSRVGIAVVAVGAQAIQDQGVKDLTDLAKLVPGLQATPSFAGNPIITLRGVGFNTRNASATAPVGIYENEVAVAYPYMSTGLLYDLDRVEVLKGPQGTLYGRNATGGLVNYVTGRPTDTAQGGATFELGNYETLNATGFVSGPITDDIRARFAFNFLNRGEGYQRDINRGERLGQLYQKSARLTVDLGGTGSPFSATLTGDYWKKDGDTLGQQAIFYIADSKGISPYGSALARASIQPNPTDVRDVGFPTAGVTPAGSARTFPGLLTDSEFYSGAAKLGLVISPSLRLQSLTSYQHLRARDVVDAAGLSTINTAADIKNRITSFSEELRLIGGQDRFNWSVGGYYARDTIDTNELYFLSTAVLGSLRNTTLNLRAANPNNPYTPSQLATSYANVQDTAQQQTEVYAGFANAEFKFNDLLKLTLGGRYTKDKTAFAGCTRDTDGGNLPVTNTLYPLLGIPTNAQGITTLQANQCYTLSAAPRDFLRNELTNNIDQSNFAFRANVDVTPNPTTLFYASISQGYKSGGFPIIAASTAAQFNPIKQEKLLAYEIGSKLRLFDRRVSLNLAAFYYNYKDRQVFGRVVDPLFTTLSLIRNVPRSREFGVEGDLAWHIIPALSVRIAGTYLDSKILEFSDFTELGVPANIRGQPFSYTPKFSGSSGVNVDTPVASNFNFIASADVSYQTKSQADSAGIPLFRIDSYTLVSGSIGLRTANNAVRVSLYAQNLFDTYYYTSVASTVDAVFRYPGLPRTFGVRAAFKF